MTDVFLQVIRVTVYMLAYSTERKAAYIPEACRNAAFVAEKALAFAQKSAAGHTEGQL